MSLCSSGYQIKLYAEKFKEIFYLFLKLAGNHITIHTYVLIDVFNDIIHLPLEVYETLNDHTFFEL